MFKILTTEEDHGTLSYLDYIYRLDYDLETNYEKTEDEMIAPAKLGLNVFTKFIELRKNISELDEEKDFLEEINKYVKFNEDLKFRNNTEENYSRYNLSILISAGSLVTQNGRRGPAHNVLISRTNFEKILEQEERDGIQRFYKVFFSNDENLDYALVWRSGATDEPGCILVKNEEKYAFVSTGFFPGAQFVKIKIK